MSGLLGIERPIPFLYEDTVKGFTGTDANFGKEGLVIGSFPYLQRNCIGL